ncbi:unnamed protein product [Gordionus sp. m RMFG-2023]
MYIDKDHLGFIKEDGLFVINNLSPGSYVIEVIHPDITFEQVRVDISKNGKVRARRVNNLQPNLVASLPYPLKIKSLFLTQYFQMREKMRMTDFLLNPMVLMMVLPLLVIMVIPKLMNSMDIDAQKEFQQTNNQLAKYDVPDLSEMMTSAFSSITSGTSNNNNKHKSALATSSALAAGIKHNSYHQPSQLPPSTSTFSNLNNRKEFKSKHK